MDEGGTLEQYRGKKMSGGLREESPCSVVILAGGLGTRLVAFGDIAWRSPIYESLPPTARYALETEALGAVGAHTLRDFAGSTRADFRNRYGSVATAPAR